MKRFIVTAVISSLISGAALAADPTNVVSSVNIVGYAKTTLPPAGNFQLGGLSFLGTNNTDMAFSELFGTNMLTKNNISTSADKVILYVNNAYVTYYQRADGTFRVVGGTVATNPILNTGTGFWLQSRAAATLTNDIYLGGSAPANATYPVIFPLGLKPFANPFSTDLDLNSSTLNWTNAGATANNISANADKINIYNSVTKTYVNYYLRAATGKFHVIGVATWTNAVIPVSGGAWYQAKKTFTNSFVRPYSVD